MQIEVEHTTENGKKIVLVPLDHSDKKAKLYEEDLDLLTELGVNLVWKFNGNNIKVYGGNRMLSVPRIIVDAGQGMCVRFFNGDRTDLRRDNLVIDGGVGKFRDRDIIRQAHKLLPNRPEIKHVFKTSNSGAGSVMN